MGLLGIIAKAVGASAIDSVIENACQQFEQFAKNILVGKRITWKYDFTFKGRLLGSISVGIKKTRNNIHFWIGGQKMTFSLSSLGKGCATAVHGAIALI